MEMQDSKRESNSQKCRNCLSENILVFLVLIGAAIGFGVGFGVRPLEASSDAVMWIGLPGDMFMKMLKMTIVPLIVASIISGTASLDPKANGKMGVMALGFVIISNFVGAFIAVALYYIFTPGKGVVLSGQSVCQNQQVLETQDLFADFIRNLMPDNVVTAGFQKTQTRYIAVEDSCISNKTNGSMLFARSVGSASGTNILGLIVVSSLIGMAASKAGDVGVPFLTFFRSSSEIMIILLKWLVWFTPIGVASLIARSVAQIKDIETTFKSLGLFIGTYTIGIVFHQLVLIPVLWLIVMRSNPFKFLLTAFRPWITVFAPPSSAVGIPEVLNTCENKHGVDQRVSRFVVLFGAAMSRMGSCYFICLSALFIASLEGIALNAVQVILIIVISSIGSLAIPAVPSASIITIIIVLSSLDIVTFKVGILMALEWYSDRLRTTSNTMNNVMGTIFIHKFCKSGLELLDQEKEKQLQSKPLDTGEEMFHINSDSGLFLSSSDYNSLQEQNGEISKITKM